MRRPAAFRRPHLLPAPFPKVTSARAANSSRPSTKLFDRVWEIIPKRISKGTAKVEGWETWKSLTPTPTEHHVSQMVKLLETYLEEGSDYAFYEYDGSVRVTPAMLIGLLCKALQLGCPLSEVVDEEVPV